MVNTVGHVQATSSREGRLTRAGAEIQRVDAAHNPSRGKSESAVLPWIEKVCQSIKLRGTFVIICLANYSRSIICELRRHESVKTADAQ